MRRGLVCAVMLVAACGLVLPGCGPQERKRSTSAAVIDKARAMKNVQEKMNYLVGQARAFYNSNEYQKSIEVARTALQYDPDSVDARQILEKAKNELKAASTKMLDDVQKSRVK